MKTYLFIGSAFLVGWCWASYENEGMVHRFATIVAYGELK